MKNLPLFLFFSALSVVMLGSCQDKVQNENPVLEIKGQTEITLPATAVEFEITYTLDNPVEGGEITAEFSADWITETGHDDGIFTFTVSENMIEEERSAVVTVKYTWPEGLSEKKVTVVQAGMEEIPADYEIQAEYFWGEYYGDEDEDGRFVWRTCISEAALDNSLSPVEEGVYYYIEILGDEAQDILNPYPGIGEYKIDAIGNDENHIVSKDNSHITIIAADGNSDLKIKEGTLDISWDEGGTRLIFELFVTDAENKVHRMVYDGKMPLFVDNSPKDIYIKEDFSLDAESCKMSCDVLEGKMIVDITLGDGSDEDANSVYMETIMQYDHEGNIPEGEYRVVESSDEMFQIFTIFPGKEDRGRMSGSMAKTTDDTDWVRYGLLTEGTMTVSGNKENYEIVCDFVTREGVKVTANYSGPAVLEGHRGAFSTLTENYVLDLEGAKGNAIFREGGDWYITLTSINDYDGDNFEISLITGGATAEEGIESGTYKAAASGVPQKGEYLQGYYNTLGMPSGTLFYNGMDWDTMSYITVAPAIEGDFVITNSGNDEYSISFSFVDDLGFTWSGEWSGTMSIVDFS